MISTPLIQQLEQLFRQQLDAAAALKQTLMDENEALIKRDPERVQELTRLKDEQSMQMESAGEQLRQLFATAGLELSQQALDEVIAAAPNSMADKLGQHSRQLETVLQECQDQNLVNGQIIAANRQSAEAALAILRGQVAPGNLTYGAGGEPISEQTRNQISKA